MKRRVLKLLMVIALLCCVIPMAASAEEPCPDSYSGQHYWSTNKHTKTCWYCGAVVTTECEYELTYDYGSSTHYEKCKICGEKRNEEAHNIQYKKGYYTGIHIAYCADCGYEGSYSSCTYSGYQNADGKHWQVCTVCNEATAKTNCSGSTKHVSGTDTHSITCSTCKNVKTVSCTFGSWSSAGPSGHSRTCTANGCNNKQTADHSMANVGTDGSTYHAVKCNDCSYTKSYSESCTYPSTYQSDDTHHWKVCTACNTAGSKTTHTGTSTYNEAAGTHTIGCACGKNVTVPCEYGSWTNNIFGSNHRRTCNVGNQPHYEEAAHNLTTSGTDGQQTHTIACSDCSYSTTESCTFSGVSYVQGDTQHWKVCTKCNTKGTMTNHSGQLTSNEDGTHSVTCNTCGKVATTACDLSGAWKYSTYPDNGHYKECSCGYTTTPEAHSDFVYEQSSFGGTHTKKCRICGKTVNDSESCDYNNSYDPQSRTDATYHYQTCTLCDKTVKTSHYFKNLKCECGAEKHEHHWVLSASGDTIAVTCDCETGACEYNHNGGTLQISASDVEYDGEAKPATVVNAINTGSHNDSSYYVTYYKKSGDSYGYGTTTAPANAGEYKAEVYSALDSSVKASVEFEIEKAELTVTASGYEGTYDGEYHGITLNVPEGKGLTVEYSSDGEYYYQYPISQFKYKDAGEYTVYYRVTDKNGNYNVKDGEGSAVVKIDKADLAALISATDYNGVYDGKSHGITVNVPDNVSVVYSEDGTNFNKYTNPGYIDVVDNKVVYYKATVNSYDEKNYETKDATGSAKVTITQLDLATVLVVTAKDTEFTYNRYDHETSPSYIPHSIELAVKDKDGNAVSYVPGVAYYNYITVEYSKDGGATWTAQNPAFTDAGEYPVQYRVYVKDEEANIKGITGTNEVKINKADLPFDSLRGYHGPYDGTYHYSFGYEVEDENQWGYTYWPYYLLDELTYSFSWTDDEGNARTSVVTGKDYFLNWYEGNIPGFKKQNVGGDDDIGVFVNVTIVGDNYNEGNFTYEVKIGGGYAWAESVTETYDGNTYYIKNYVPVGTKMQYKLSENDTWLPASQEPGRKDVGTSYIDWRASFDSDGDGDVGGYNAAGEADENGIYNTFGTKEVFTSEGKNYVKINPISLTVTANSHTINVGEEYDVNGYGYKVTNSSNAEVDIELEGTPVYTFEKNADGNYTIKISGLTHPNYEIIFVDGLLTVNDNLPPVIEGIEDGKNYSEDTPFTVTDDNLEKVTIQKDDDDEAIELVPNADGTYTLPSDNNTYIVTATDKSGNETSVTVTTFEIYNVEVDKREGTEVTGNATVKHGQSHKFTVEIEEGYRKTAAFAVTVKGIKVDGTDAVVTDNGDGTYTVESVGSDIKIKVDGVEKIPYHDVTASEGEGYKVSGDSTVKHGDNYKFNVDIESGYKKGDNFKVTVNGKEVKPNLLGQYVIRNVHDDLHIEVSGVVKKSVTVVKKTGPTETPYTGDTFNLAFWGTVMASSFVLAVAAFVVLMKIMRNKGKHNK